jgi:hypothetical protein
VEVRQAKSPVSSSRMKRDTAFAENACRTMPVTRSLFQYQFQHMGTLCSQGQSNSDLRVCCATRYDTVDGLHANQYTNPWMLSIMWNLNVTPNPYGNCPNSRWPACEPIHQPLDAIDQSVGISTFFFTGRYRPGRRNRDARQVSAQAQRTSNTFTILHNLILLLRCPMSSGIAPVALQAIPSALPALVNPTVRALPVAKLWWLILQHRCAPFVWNICSTWSKCSTASPTRSSSVPPFPISICCLVAVTLLHGGSQTFIRSPLSCCAGVADFAGLCRILPREGKYLLRFQGALKIS